MSSTSNFVNIVPKEFIISNIATKVNFKITNFVLNTSISISTIIYNENDVAFKFDSFEISGDEYNNWVNSDEYIINLILSKLGLQQQK